MAPGAAGPAMPATRSPGPAADSGVEQAVVPVAEVSAEVAGGRPVLTAPGVGRIGLYNGELHALPHRVFAPPRVVPPPPVETGVHTPRLRLPGVVLQRERWRLPRAELFPGSHTGDSPELLRDYRAAARRFGIPRYVFARVAGDRKPILVDAGNWFLLQLLYHHVPPGGEVVLTEMLPGPDQLWLRGAAGRFCAELRMVAYRGRSGG